MKEKIGSNSVLKPWQYGKRTVLLAEDEEDIRELSRRILEDAGYAVIVTDNGYSALSILQEFGDCIDVLLLDMTMPIMDGEWVLREMKNRRHNIPVIICSGLAIDEIRRKSRGCAVRGILAKPCSAKELLEAVSMASDNSSAFVCATQDGVG